MKETNMTPQQLWRTGVGTTKQEQSAVSEGPSPAWRAQFKAQATQDMMDDVYGYVARRATWIEHQQGRRTPGLIREMIQDALGDTFAGIVAWDPSRCSLALHLKSVIRSRLSHELERAEQFAHVGVDADIGDVVVKLGSRRFDGFGGHGDRLERLVVDDDPLGRVLGGGDGLGDHHDHLLSDVSHPVGRQ